MSEENKSCSLPSSAEPTATRSTVPMWIIVVTLVLVFIGFVFFDRHSGWFNAKVYAPYASVEKVDAYQPGTGPNPMIAGKKNYEMFCASCHGSDGAGKVGQAPPLAGSELVLGKGVHRLAMIPLQGLAGPIKVMGKDWNMIMAPMGAALPEADLAAVLTYMRNSWGNKASEVTADDIKAIKAEIGTHPLPIPGEKLMTMPE